MGYLTPACQDIFDTERWMDTHALSVVEDGIGSRPQPPAVNERSTCVLSTSIIFSECLPWASWHLNARGKPFNTFCQSSISMVIADLETQSALRYGRGVVMAHASVAHFLLPTTQREALIVKLPKRYLQK
ncbi:MAG: hypothetical protein H7240_02625 [Glaciimonas sp.]|nr:hypothetical protein [Glaciimonas sp.]